MPRRPGRPACPEGAPPALPFFMVRKIQAPSSAMVRPPDAYAWHFRTAPDANQPRGMMMDRKAWRQVAASMMLAAAAALVPAQAGQAPGPAAPPKPYAMPAGIPDYIRNAVQSPDRTPAMTARDADRKPAELLALSGVKPGDKVVEFAGFGNYFTTLLSHIVGERGSVLMNDLPYTEERYGAASRDFVQKHPNTRYEIADYNEVTLPTGVDVVFNVLYYHDLPLNKIDTAKLNAKIF